MQEYEICSGTPLAVARNVKRRIHQRHVAYLEHSVLFGGTPRQLLVYLGTLPMSGKNLQKAADEAMPRLPLPGKRRRLTNPP